MNPFKKLYTAMGRHVHSPYASHALALFFFIEAMIFVPVSSLLILYCLERRNLALRYAFIATAASVVGGVIAYGVGYLMQDYLSDSGISWLLHSSQFLKAVSFYKTHKSATVLLAGLTPLPYKALTLTAGFCKLPLFSFIVCSLISRGARFFFIATIVALWGDKIKLYIDRYFNILVLLFTVIVGGVVWYLI